MYRTHNATPLHKVGIGENNVQEHKIQIFFHANQKTTHLVLKFVVCGVVAGPPFAHPVEGVRLHPGRLVLRLRVLKEGVHGKKLGKNENRILNLV